MHEAAQLLMGRPIREVPEVMPYLESYHQAPQIFRTYVDADAQLDKDGHTVITTGLDQQLERVYTAMLDEKRLYAPLFKIADSSHDTRLSIMGLTRAMTGQTRKFTGNPLHNHSLRDGTQTGIDMEGDPLMTMTGLGNDEFEDPIPPIPYQFVEAVWGPELADNILAISILERPRSNDRYYDILLKAAAKDKMFLGLNGRFDLIVERVNDTDDSPASNFRDFESGCLQRDKSKPIIEFMKNGEVKKAGSVGEFKLKLYFSEKHHNYGVRDLRKAGKQRYRGKMINFHKIADRMDADFEKVLSGLRDKYDIVPELVSREEFYASQVVSNPSPAPVEKRSGKGKPDYDVTRRKLFGRAAVLAFGAAAATPALKPAAKKLIAGRRDPT